MKWDESLKIFDIVNGWDGVKVCVALKSFEAVKAFELENSLEEENWLEKEK